MSIFFPVHGCNDSSMHRWLTACWPHPTKFIFANLNYASRGLLSTSFHSSTSFILHKVTQNHTWELPATRTVQRSLPIKAAQGQNFTHVNFDWISLNLNNWILPVGQQTWRIWTPDLTDTNPDIFRLWLYLMCNLLFLIFQQLKCLQVIHLFHSLFYS